MNDAQYLHEFCVNIVLNLRSEGDMATLEKSKTARNRNGKSGSSDYRVHVSFPENMKEKLDEIKINTDQSSLSEVFRTALKFYTLAYEEHQKGSDFLIRDHKGELERLRMFM